MLLGLSIRDIGVYEEKPADYPDIALAVAELITSGAARVRVLETPDSWFGITYREDLPRVVAGMRSLIDAGHYPERLA